MDGDASSDGKLYAIVMQQVASHNADERLSWFNLTEFGTTSGVLISGVLDGGSKPNWSAFSWDVQRPRGTSLTVEVRTSNNPSKLGTFVAVPHAVESLAGLVDTGARYLQYRLSVASSGVAASPAVEQVSV